MGIACEHGEISIRRAAGIDGGLADDSELPALLIDAQLERADLDGGEICRLRSSFGRRARRSSNGRRPHGEPV